MARLPLAERFWTKVQKTNGCWLWTGSVTSRGYGNSWVRSNNDLAHRIAWQLTRGPIPDGMYVCHHCDVPLCCNPDHLFLGTQQENLQDMSAKGRHVGSTKLSDAIVLAIRTSYATGNITQQTLADRYGVHQSLISLIVHHKTRHHLT